jgi:hypothetical protein
VITSIAAPMSDSGLDQNEIRRKLMIKTWRMRQGGQSLLEEVSNPVLVVVDLTEKDTLDLRHC